MARSLSRREFLGSVLATAGVSGMLLSGCGGNGREKQAEGTPSGVPKRGGTIRSATPALLGLDPMTTEGVQLAPNFYSSVVQMTDWRGTVGDLALSWEVVDDLEWIFRLRPDARFHDVVGCQYSTRIWSADTQTCRAGSPWPGVGSDPGPLWERAAARELEHACSSDSSTAATRCAASGSLSPVAPGPGQTANQARCATGMTRTGSHLALALVDTTEGKGLPSAGGGRGSQGEGRAASAEYPAGETRGGEGRGQVWTSERTWCLKAGPDALACQCLR